MRKIFHLEIKSENIVKFADYYESQLLPTTLSILYNFGLVYQDQKLKEDIYSATISTSESAQILDKHFNKITLI